MDEPSNRIGTHPLVPTPDAVPRDADVRLVVADLDGTLLDQYSRIPSGLWSLLGTMRRRGILFAPASGRQYATVSSMFERAGSGTPIIAENGAYVMRDGAEIDSTVLDRKLIVEAVGLVRELAGHGHDVGIVLCGKRSAYVERADEAFLAQARTYYVALAIVDDVLEASDDFLKIAVFDFGDAERVTAPALAGFRGDHQVVVSGRHWVDIMPAGVNKGKAVRSLQRELGISHEQTAAFGDYLNDLEMLDAAGLSFAVANAHPEVIARARAVIPPNTENGVLTTLERLLGICLDRG